MKPFFSIHAALPVRVALGMSFMFWIVCFLLPLALMFVVSWISRGPYGGLDWTWTGENYVRLLDSLVLGIFLKSFGYALGTTLVCGLLGFPLAYCIARSSKSWQQWLLILVMIPFWTNFLVRTYAWVLIFRADGVVNGFLKILGQDPISLLFTDFSVCVGLVYGYLPFMVLPLVSALERIPIQVEEAARDLFATRLEALWHVVVPLSRPGWVAGSVLVFIPSLGAFITPYLLGGGQSLMIGTLIQQEFLVARDWPFGAALSFGLMAVILMLWGWLGRKPEEQSMI
ncbi:MAG: ABC transporter permease [Nitrospirales bacterium]|nr:ABC transporter permease [Nitrospirales bacterium]